MLHCREMADVHRVQVGALPMARQKLASVHLRGGRGCATEVSFDFLKQNHLKVNPALVWWRNAASIYQRHRF